MRPQCPVSYDYSIFAAGNVMPIEQGTTEINAPIQFQLLLKSETWKAVYNM
jgi:hypothetical protein